MMTKMFMLLSLVKGQDNVFVGEKMSTPLVNYILLGVILLVGLMRVLSWLQFLHLKREATKRFAGINNNGKIEEELPVAYIYKVEQEYNEDETGQVAIWVYDIECNMFASLHNNALSEGGMSYNTGLTLVHPDDREMYVSYFRRLSSGLTEKATEFLRFYHNGEYETYRFNAIALRSVVTGEVEKIIGTEENISEYHRKFTTV